MEAVSTPVTPNSRARLGWLAFVVLACAHFSVLYVWRSPQFLNLVRYSHGEEQLPYQGRVLMAWVLGLTAGNSHLAPLLLRLASHLPLEFHNPYLVVLLFTAFFSMLAAILAARASLLHLTHDHQFASWAALLTLYMAYFNLVDVYGLSYSLPYDVPSLALFSLAVWLVFTQRYWLLLPVFLVGTLNRETFCFITVFLVLYAWFGANTSESRAAAMRRIVPHVVIQAIVWVALRLWLHHHFLQNGFEAGQQGGGFFDLHLLHNLKSLLNPFQWPLLLGLFGFTLPLLIHSYRWISDRALARSVAILLPLWALAMLLVGVVVEIRVFDELTVFLVPCIGLIVWNRWVLPARR
ncbi:hypothetical protein [Granulicella mallensis]|uniref:Uncharacterized protein n=1 Tax=Granulicella mallensis TaxID=940614 RepID=A0A7W7ZM37_9BACT|nr:hypothetical protein [Granulicella mallensis]MBB5061691.1 hypothetical protein [Granulicella mallensis]